MFSVISAHSSEAGEKKMSVQFNETLNITLNQNGIKNEKEELL